MKQRYCKYCNNAICGSGRKMTIAEWNKCPYQRADWEVSTSVVCWTLDILTFGVAKILITAYKARRYAREGIALGEK